MCGLVGVIGGIHQKEVIALHWMLHFDVVRGHHSTGVAAIHNWDHVSLFKELGQPHNLYASYPEQWKDGLYQPKDVTCLIGHNRWATQGQITKETAHPFEFDNVVGAHNGTVQKWSMHKLHGHKDFQIDSQIIYSHLSHTKGDVQSLWDVADGAIALTWWDKVDRTLKVARNKERPLYYTKVKNKETLFWASEPWMLRVALEKARIEHEEVFSFSVDTLYTIDYDKKIKITKAPLKPYSPPKYFGNTNIFTGGASSYKSYKGFSKSKSESLPPQQKVFFKVDEYNQTGLQVWEGSFFGVLENGEEIRISTQGYNQKIDYEQIMKACDDKRPYFEAPRNRFYDMHGMINVHSGNITHLKHVLQMPFGAEKEPSPLATVMDHKQLPINKAEFDDRYQSICCCCNETANFEDVFKAANSNKPKYLFLNHNLIVCPTCQEDQWVIDNVINTFAGAE